jgi:hypothetical protein
MAYSNRVHICDLYQQVQQAFQELSASGLPLVTLLFSHLEIRQDIPHDCLPIVSSVPLSQQTHNQLNKRWDFLMVADHLRKAPPYEVIMDGDVLNTTTKVMKLTREKLLQQQDWNNWQESEYLQLNQYEDQGMFGHPSTAVLEEDAVFHLVWTYNIKAVNGCKKARCICDSSTQSGQVRILAKTYTNCVDQTRARLFYAVAATKNLLVYGVDISNTFAKAPPPKQGFYICPD